MRYSYSIALVLVLLFSATLVIAETGQTNSGRLPDGRAYRTDAQGSKLVDHMAELEATVLELKGEVTALEDELIDRERIISALRKGEPIAPAPAPARREIPSTPVAGTSAMQLQNAEWLQRNQQLEQTVASLNSQLRQESERFNLLQREASVAQGEQETGVGSLRDELSIQQNKLSSAEKVVSSLKEELQQQKEIASAQMEELEIAKAALEETRGKLQTAKSDFSDREKQLLAVVDTTQRSSSNQQLASNRTKERASLRRSTNAAAGSAVIANPSATKDELKAEKQRLNTQLAEIQRLILQRKSLADAAKSKGRGVSVSMQPLVTRTGLSLDRLRSEIAKLNEKSNLAGIRVGLSEIEKVLKDDIGVLGRLSKL